jgi:glycerol-3-phosphate dehydrogenase
MAEDAVNQAATLARLPEVDCPTRGLNIHGYHQSAAKFGELALYGADALAIQDLARAEPGLKEPLHPSLPVTGAEVVFAARHEMARTVEDVLARRTRALFLDARAAAEMGSRTAELLARELGRDAGWREAQVRAFRELCAGYQLGPGPLSAFGGRR